MTPRDAATPRATLIADTAIRLLAERGLRGLTHRAVDEAAGLPLGSTSNHARTRAALLEAAVRRLAALESAVHTSDVDASDVDSSVLESSDETAASAADTNGAEALADFVATALHRQLTRHRALLVARYELALEATRRPELRAHYDRTGKSEFAGPLRAMLSAAGSTAPERHTLALLAWCEGILFTCTAGSFSTDLPTEEELRADLQEILAGMLQDSDKNSRSTDRPRRG
jgi:DNA-binding transcriptional regulator YbjK